MSAYCFRANTSMLINRRNTQIFSILIACIAFALNLQAKREINYEGGEGGHSVTVDGVTYHLNKAETPMNTGLSEKAMVAELGNHWSSLDRYELLLALKEDDDELAESLISEAASGSEVLQAHYLILIELNSTPVFEPYAKELKKVTRHIVDVKPGRGLNNQNRQSSELLRFQLYKDVLKEKEKAKECLISVLGESKKRKLDKHTRMDEVSMELNATETMVAKLLLKEKQTLAQREKIRTRQKRKRSDELPIGNSASGTLAGELPANPVDLSNLQSAE